MKTIIALVATLVLSVATIMPSQAGVAGFAEPGDSPSMHKVCYIQNHAGRTRAVRCNTNVWPYNQFSGKTSTYSLQDLLDLGARFKDFTRDLGNLFK